MAYLTSGLDEIQQIRAELQQIRSIINEMEPQLERVPKQLITFRELERVALRYLVLAKYMGLPEDMGRAISFIARLVTAFRSAQISISLMLSTNPVTAALGVAGLTGVAMSYTDTLAGY